MSYDKERPLGWTTREESLRLIEAGIDPESNDLYYHIDNNYGDYPDATRRCMCENLPCWSIGALEAMIPDTIKVNNVEFHFHATYNRYDRWAACYEDESYNRHLTDRAWRNQIEMYASIVQWLLENDYIKKGGER